MIVLLTNKFMEKSMLKEETHSEHSTLELISCMLPLEESQVLTFGKMVLRRLKPMLILTLLTIPRLPKKLRWKLKTKLIELSLKDILSVNISKGRKKLNQSMASIFIKEVLFLVTKFVSSILKVLMLRPAAEHIAIILQKLDGLRSTNQLVSAMVSYVYTTLPIRRFSSH